MRKTKPGKTRAQADTSADGFREPARPPTDHELTATLGGADPLWRRFADHLRHSFGPLVDEWSFSKTLGWTLRLKQPARVLVYLTPKRSHFLASVVLGDQACTAIRDAGVQTDVQALIDASPKYAEGRGVRIPVRTPADLQDILTIVELKVATTR